MTSPRHPFPAPAALDHADDGWPFVDRRQWPTELSHSTGPLRLAPVVRLSTH